MRCNRARNIETHKSSRQRDWAAYSASQRIMVRTLPRGNLFLPAARGSAKFFQMFSVREYFPHGRKYISSAFPRVIQGFRHPRCRHGWFKKYLGIGCPIIVGVELKMHLTKHANEVHLT